MGRILITSRSASSKVLGEGLELLFHACQAEVNDGAVVEKILARLEYHPLAIDQARAYILRQRLRLVDFEGEYERRKRYFINETPPVWQYCRGVAETPQILLTTWELSFKLLDDDMEYGRKRGGMF